MVRFFDGRALLVRGTALLALLALIAGAARANDVQAQSAFFSLLFPQLTDWLVAPWDAIEQDEAAIGEAVAL